MVGWSDEGKAAGVSRGRGRGQEDSLGEDISTRTRLGPSDHKPVHLPGSRFPLALDSGSWSRVVVDVCAPPRTGQSRRVRRWHGGSSAFIWGCQGPGFANLNAFDLVGF